MRYETAVFGLPKTLRWRQALTNPPQRIRSATEIVEKHYYYYSALL